MKPKLAPILVLISLPLFSSGLYLPSLPAIAKDFSTSATLMKLSLATYFLGFALFQLVYGPLSDRFGRKPICYLGLTIGWIGSILCVLSWDIESFMFARFIQGAGLSCGGILARAMLRDHFSGEKLAHYASYLTIVVATAMSLAPTVGGYIQTALNWHWSFALIALYTLVVFFIVWRFLPETHLTPTKVALIKNYGHLITQRVFVINALCAFLSFGGLSAYFAASPFLMTKTLQISPITYGHFGIIIGVATLVGGRLNVLFLRHFGRHRSLLLGVSLLIFGALLMLIPSVFGYVSASVILVPMWVYTVGIVLVQTNAYANAFTPFAHIAGTTAALYGTFQVLGGSLISSCVALMPETTQLPLSLTLLAMGVGCLLLQLTPIKRRTSL